MILAADIGGTKTLLGVFRAEAGKLRRELHGEFPSQDFPSLEAMVEEFLGGIGRVGIRTAAVGVAGPVVSGRSHVVNLRWPVDEKRLARKLAIPRARVLNDLEATAWGIPELPSSKLVSLTPRLRPGAGNAALLAAGTGLGMALLVRTSDGLLPLPSEGGHQHFAPRDELEIELLRYMRQRHGRVSVERLVAGPGFLAIYQFLVQSGRGKETAAMTRRLERADDKNAAVSEAGVMGEDATAEKAVNLFVSLFGAAAGDLALVAKATGGVYVGGGITPKLLPKLRSGDFLHSFRDKGRLSPLLEKIPVRVILEPETALLGAAACAARDATQKVATARRGRRKSPRK